MIPWKAGILLTVALWFVAGCSDEGMDPSPSGFTVSGNVVTARGPEQGVSVSIDAALNWSTTTDARGHFEIRGVTPGTHSFRATKSSINGSFSEKSTSVIVNGDLLLQSVLLPIPVTLESPIQLPGSRVELVWHPTDAADFREYKLYRKGDPGLDETTGDLSFVSTARLDTTFVDGTTFVGQEYYYRVYVMNEFGRVGGSNLVSIRTAIQNLVPDGSFEISGSLVQYWGYSASRPDISVTIDSTVSHSARYSLHVSFVYNAQGTAVPVSLTRPLNLRPNTPYRLSFYLKVRGERNNTDDLFVHILQGSSYVSGMTIVANNDYSTRSVDADWAEWTHTFLVTSDTPISLRFVANNENVWLDDITLLPL